MKRIAKAMKKNQGMLTKTCVKVMSFETVAMVVGMAGGGGGGG